MIDVDALQKRLDRPDHQLVKQSLQDVGFGEGRDFGLEEGVDLLTSFAGEASAMSSWTQGAQINTDRNLRLQYLAGMSLNSSLDPRVMAGIRAAIDSPTKSSSARRSGSAF